MDDGNETLMPPPAFDLDLDDLPPDVDADSFMLPDNLPVPILPDNLLTPTLPDDLSTPNKIEAGVEALFEGASTIERPEFDLIMEAEPDSIEAEPDSIEAASAFGVPQQLVPFFSRPETALVPTQRMEIAEPPLLSVDSAVDQEKHVVFSLAGSKYAVPMSHVLEVCELEHFTPVPNVPEWVMGITSLRGDIASIVNIRALLSSEPDEWSEARSLLVTQTLEGDITVCLAVERVIGLANVSVSGIQTLNSVIRDRLTPYVRGIHAGDGELLSVLNLESLLRSLEIVN